MQCLLGAQELEKLLDTKLMPQSTHITSCCCCELRLLAKVLWYPSLLGDVVVVVAGIVADSIDIGEAM